MLFGGSAICYIFGYIKSLILFRAISLTAIPTDIYTPFDLLVSGLTFIISALSVPIIIWGSYQLTTLIIDSFPFLRDIVDRYLKRSFSIGFALAAFLVIIVASSIQITPVLLNIEYKVYIALLTAVIFTILAFGIYTFTSNQQRGVKQWLALAFSTFIWVITMFFGQFYAINNISTGESFQMTRLGQHPGITGYLILKDNINGSKSSYEIPGAYKVYGVLLAKNEKLYYFAALPHSATGSSLYILPENRVYGFQAIISFEQFKPQNIPK
ncbi:hypothetical protein SAMN04515679_0529 [Pelosinus fermentans]|nr:hypothetical protein FR7_00476 [Pelosinus fermentans DSM 17108]SDQ45617.1 hypothetical protein SAMN04515679_0529 [Pelosinus fermentans]